MKEEWNMSNKKNYIGITIGPIVDTLIMTSTPAGLWGASYIFSYFTRKLVEKIEVEFELEEDSFLSPAWDDMTKDIVEKCRWAGLFHDRIIFELRIKDEDILKKLQCIIDKTKGELGGKIAETLIKTGDKSIKTDDVVRYIKDYIRVYAVQKELEGELNPILELGKDLDALELQQTYISREGANYLLKFFENRLGKHEKMEKSKNTNIKDSFLVKEGGVKEKNWHFFDNTNKQNVITIDDIAGVHNKEVNTNTQKKNYFVLVQADGDNLGKVLQSMKGNSIKEDIQNFSKACFSYAEKTFRIVSNYGGRVIYAGGDDVLFLAPVNNGPKTVFELIEELKDCFACEFANFSFDGGKKMGFSAGVIICYHKYPLYEALSEALSQLHEAKSTSIKNTLSIYFEKHSGKGSRLQFVDFSQGKLYSSFLGLLKKYLFIPEKDFDKEDFLRSVSQKMNFHQKLLIEALKRGGKTENKYLKTVMINLFDEYEGIFEQTANRSDESIYIETIITLLCNLYVQSCKENIEEPEIQALHQIDTIIRLVAFYREKERD